MGLTGDYLAVQKLNADPNTYNATNYLTLNHAGNTTNNFFSILLFFRFQQQAKVIQPKK
jgi:hypothetical protein